MSYDPFDPGSDVPPPDEYGAPMSPQDPSYMRPRVMPPAIALIVVGILNLLAALVQVGGTVLVAVQSPQDVEKNQMIFVKLLPPEAQKEFQKQMEEQRQQTSPEAEKVRSVIINIVLSLLMLVAAILSVLGGVRMLSLRSFALCVTGAISAAIPCITCSGCCAFGEIIGIWALIVLLNPEVKAAFR